MKKAVVLLSGGLDSSTTLALARYEGYSCYALTFDYAQRHRIELEAAGRVASSIGVLKHLITAFDLRETGASALTSDIDVPKQMREERGEGTEDRGQKGERHSRIPVTYVPARNTIFLSFALGWAEMLEAGSIFIGANAVDYSGYPDCRPEYLKSFEDMANLATRISVEEKIRFQIRAPLLLMSKGEIIRKGTELGLDYSLTWSCYDPTPEGRPCNLCDSCRFREKGFFEAGIKDPLS